MTMIDAATPVRPPTTPSGAASDNSRIPAPALRGAAVLIAVVALTIPAHLTLHDTPTTSGVIAAATAYGVIALLNVVLAASLWRLLQAGALSAALTGVLTLMAASGFQLYAALTLIWNDRSALAGAELPLAAAQALLGAHLVVMAFGAARVRSAPVFATGLGLSGAAALVAVFPPTWYPQTTDALLAVALGHVTLMLWFLTRRTRSRIPRREPVHSAPATERSRTAQ